MRKTSICVALLRMAILLPVTGTGGMEKSRRGLQAKGPRSTCAQIAMPLGKINRAEAAAMHPADSEYGSRRWHDTAAARDVGPHPGSTNPLARVFRGVLDLLRQSLIGLPAIRPPGSAQRLVTPPLRTAADIATMSKGPEDMTSRPARDHPRLVARTRERSSDPAGSLHGPPLTP